MVVEVTFVRGLSALLIVVVVTRRESLFAAMVVVVVVVDGAIVELTTITEADRYPVRETRTVTVAESPAVSPVTVASPVSPSVTEPTVVVSEYAVVEE